LLYWSDMKKQDILSILITFVVGMVAGAYLFFTGFAPQFLAHNGATDTTYSEFTLTGETYGSCSRTGSCPSFQILSDGSFSYLSSTIFTGTATIEGNLPGTLLNELRLKFTLTALENGSRSVKVASCASYVDGLDYRYEVILESVVYDLDTCGKNFSVNSELGVTLDKLWNYFATEE